MTTTQMAPIKVLHTCQSIGAGPLGQTLVRLARFATDANHVVYVASAEGPMLEPYLREGGLHIPMAFDAPYHAYKAPIEGYKLAKHVRENGIDIIHAHCLRTYNVALWAGKFSGKPVVVSVNSLETPKKYARRAQGVVVESKFMADALKLKHAHICPPSFDPHVLNAKNLDAVAVDGLWSAWDVPSATGVILITEPLVEGSGYRLFIEALGSMKNLAFKAIVCADTATNTGADNTLFTDLWHRVEELGLSRNVLFIDTPTTPTELKNTLAAADVVVYPNRAPDAEAQSVVNAQAMGKAVIVNTPSNRAEIVVSGETGWLMSLANDDTAHQKLALAMTDAITDLPRLQKIGTTATRHCKENYQDARVFTDLFDFYQTFRHAG